MLDRAKLIEQAGAEMDRLPGNFTRVQLTPISALSLIGILQLALRHPKLPGSEQAMALALCDALRKGFVAHQCPACLEIIRQGAPSALPMASQDVILDEAPTAPAAIRKEAA